MPINNAFYDDLGDRWYDAHDDPVALLRVEAAFRNPLVQAWLEETAPGRALRVLDVGCGGGFLSNFLAQIGHQVTGVDLSPNSLETARRHDRSGGVRYLLGDALALPFADACFDAVCCTDVLEHVDRPGRAFEEASRVLVAGGPFVFHTFNRTLLSRLLVVHLVEWLVRNTPAHMHDHRLFITPAEIRAMCAANGLTLQRMQGIRPVLLTRAALRMARTGVVPPDFRFTTTRSLRVAYLGLAVKQGKRNAS